MRNPLLSDDLEKRIALNHFYTHLGSPGDEIVVYKIIGISERNIATVAIYNRRGINVGPTTNEDFNYDDGKPVIDLGVCSHDRRAPENFRVKLFSFMPATHMH